jgi:hypothetical protein
MIMIRWRAARLQLTRVSGRLGLPPPNDDDDDDYAYDYDYDYDD